MMVHTYNLKTEYVYLSSSISQRKYKFNFLLTYFLCKLNFWTHALNTYISFTLGIDLKIKVFVLAQMFKPLLH